MEDIKGPEAPIKLYVCGFCFSPDLDLVALIKKNKPDWQIDQLNGIGGKIEEGELPSQAMVREFREETGVTILEDDWKDLGVLKNDEWQVFFYFAVSPQIPDKLESLTDEEVMAVHVKNLNNLPVIPNLRWLIPMALDPNHQFFEGYAK